MAPKLMAASMLVLIISFDGSSTPAAAQNLPGIGLGGIFFPKVYGMRLPNADNAYIRQRTAKSQNNRGSSNSESIRPSDPRYQGPYRQHGVGIRPDYSSPSGTSVGACNPFCY